MTYCKKTNPNQCTQSPIPTTCQDYASTAWQHDSLKWQSPENKTHTYNFACFFKILCCAIANVLSHAWNMPLQSLEFNLSYQTLKVASWIIFDTLKWQYFIQSYFWKGV